MTIAQMATYFSVLQDKYGSPYFTNSEISLFLNRASVDFVKELVPVNLGKVNFELSKDTLSEIAPLLYDIPQFALPTGGLITKAYLQTALNAIVPGAILWRPASLSWVFNGRTVPIDYVRPNDWYEFQNNFFKNPGPENPKCTETALTYKVLPVYNAAKVNATLFKYPVTVDIDGGVSSDLPDHTHDKIVTMALELAGIGTRDEMLAQLLTLHGGNSQTTSHLG